MRTLNFTCKLLQGTCKFVIYLQILIVHFWELLVKLFVKPAQGLATSFVDANRQPSFFSRKNFDAIVLHFFDCVKQTFSKNVLLIFNIKNT